MENKKATPVCETGAAEQANDGKWKEMTLEDAVDMLLDMRFAVELDFKAPLDLRERYARLRKVLWDMVFANLPQLDADRLTDGRFRVICKERGDGLGAS